MVILSRGAGDVSENVSAMDTVDEIINDVHDLFGGRRFTIFIVHSDFSISAFPESKSDLSWKFWSKIESSELVR